VRAMRIGAMKPGRSKRLVALTALIVVGFMCVAAFAATVRITATSRIPSNLGLGNLACPPSGQCVATGVGPFPAYVLKIAPISRGGKLGRVVTEPAASYPDGLACPTSNFCLATALSADSRGRGYIFPIHNGVPGVPQVLDQIGIGSLACGGPASCWAFGGLNTGTRAGRALHIVNGRLVHIYDIPAADAGFAACISADRCLMLGATKLVSFDNGRIVGLSPLPASSIKLYGIGCQNSTTCTVVGYPTTGRGVPTGAVVASVSGGRIGPLVPVKGVGGGLAHIDCSPTVCLAFGSTRNANGQEVMVPIVDGVVGTPIPVNVSDAVCTARGCLALGSVRNGRRYQGAVLTFHFPPA
jgi:hypothetical protein